MRQEFDAVQLKARKKRTILSAIISFILIPLTIFVGIVFLDDQRYLLVSLFIVVYTMIPFFLVYENRKPKAREIVTIAMMSAIVVFFNMISYMMTPFQPGTDSPYGVSLLRSMPFLSGILLKIYQAVGQNWERAGNLRFAVVCKPGEGDGLSAQERGELVASEWSAAMRSTRQGAVRDFVAVGDVDIKVIGADSPILDSQVPVRQILEQLVARTGIPPFMLGLSWSSTERMSAQQADLLTSEITAIRRGVEPALCRVAELWLGLHGYDRRAEILWEDINLQDEVEEARAELYRAQAEQLRRQNESTEEETT